MIVNLSKRPIDPKQAGILNAALMLFLHWDFKDVTVKQIISAADLSKGIFYKYYGSKNDLLLDLLMDEVFHVDQWVAQHDKELKDRHSVKAYFLMIGRHLERYQLHQRIERYLVAVDLKEYSKFKRWKKQHGLWIKHQLLKGVSDADILYAQLWSMLEGCSLLNANAHFQYLSGKRHPFEYFVQKMG
ncbi:TetR/AcrR family transcriptional regulator [Marinicellulosiphila megalodicopiae]|uniref:TetR/AcrR family transcriptional regulator n=1 Tax=Marinicellulosiphila megalodicopiae TaxID=2724896 RepID=UPI003BAECFF7